MTNWNLKIRPIFFSKMTNWKLKYYIFSSVPLKKMLIGINAFLKYANKPYSKQFYVIP